jgi:WD40 repeat protein
MGNMFPHSWICQYPRCPCMLEDTLAVGLESGDIIILNAITGSHMAVLSEHTIGWHLLPSHQMGHHLYLEAGMAPSNSGMSRLVGLSRPSMATLLCVHSVSISADCTMIASGSSNGTIQLWDIQTGGCHHVTKQASGVMQCCFLSHRP